MRFFLQLALAELPEAASYPLRDGILQMFYCSGDDGNCETWTPFTGTHDIRIVPVGDELADSPGSVEVFPRGFIVDWTETSDAPHPEEHQALGLTYDYDFENDVVDVRCAEPPIALEKASLDLDVAEAISSPLSGDKLGGWPDWVQSTEYPNCPECRTQMQLLLQVDSEDNLPYMFGDAGCAHLTYCPNHPEVLAFGWACS